MKLTDEERTWIARSLLMWRNHIQTGNVVLSRNDLLSMTNVGLQPKKTIKILSSDQEELCNSLERLAEKVDGVHQP